jgi:hypothetical protein
VFTAVRSAPPSVSGVFIFTYLCLGFATGALIFAAFYIMQYKRCDATHILN